MMKMFVLLNILLILPAVFGTRSGFYVDNGHGQTVMHDDVTPEARHEIERDILTLLGLPDRPRKSHVHRPSLKKSAPRFLLNIYHQLSESADPDSHSRVKRSSDSGSFLSAADQKAIARSDVIMTFVNKHHHVDEVRHEKGNRLWFDISKVKTPEISLVMAELRVYQSMVHSKWKSKREFRVSVYAVGEVNGQEDLELVAVKNVTNNHEGWTEFRLTKLFHSWIHQNKPNRGLYISAETTDQDAVHEIKLADIGVITSKGDDNQQPFMVGFFKGPQVINSKVVLKSHNRVRRAAAMRRKKVTENKNPILHGPDRQKSCRIQTLYVNFKDLGWIDWVVAPDGYYASYCSGECNFPLNAHMNATNHAIVQTLVHLTTPSKAPKPCCAPIKLIPISILYYVEDSNVNMKKFKNMVVKSCGCQ